MAQESLSTDEQMWLATKPSSALAWLSTLSVPWWIAEGWALDMFLGYESRPHKDLDIGILKRDLPEVLSKLSSWEIFEARNRKLTRLHARAAQANVHSLWCRRKGTAHWAFELMLDQSEGQEWLFRRQAEIRREIRSIVCRNAEGLPFLIPEIQLLYKARVVRAEDQADFDRVNPRLTDESRAWLRDALRLCEPNHPWLVALTPTHV